MKQLAAFLRETIAFLFAVFFILWTVLFGFLWWDGELTAWQAFIWHWVTGTPVALILFGIVSWLNKYANRKDPDER